MRKVGEFAIASVAACCLATALCAQQSNQPGAADTSKSSTASKPADKTKATPANGQPNPQSVPGSQTGPQSGISSTIRVPVDLVNVPFTVLDKKNRMVIDLTQKDFRILEDRQPQKITFFSRESNLPLRIGILIDTSNSIRERLHFEQEAAIDFLSETLRPEKDQAFAVAFDVEPQLLQAAADIAHRGGVDTLALREHLERRERPSTEGPQRLGLGGVPLAEDDDRRDDLLAARIGQADHVRLLDRGMAEQDGAHIEGTRLDLDF